MSQQDPHRKPHGEDDVTARQTEAQPDIENAQPETGAQDDLESSAEQQLEQARGEVEKYRDLALRTQAEMENLRKRTQRELESARKFAVEKFASELLGVCDSMDLGLQSAESGPGDFDKFREGMEMTRRMLLSAMEKAGVEVIDPEGETFDPDYHEAVATQPTDEQAPGTVMAVMQKGYTLNGRVLRAAMVTVAKSQE